MPDINPPHLATTAPNISNWNTDLLSLNRFRGGLYKTDEYCRTKYDSPIPLKRSVGEINTEEKLGGDKLYPELRFIECHTKLLNNLKNLFAGGCCNPYDTISDTIYNYDQSLTYLPDDITDVFFDFTDLLEGLLLACKRRSIDIINIKVILENMNDIYVRIYSLMLSQDRRSIHSITEELSQLKDEIDSRGLLPTYEEYDAELSETMATLSDDEKKELAGMFTRY